MVPPVASNNTFFILFVPPYPSNRLYAPDPADVEWANGVVKVFEEEGLAKGKAAVSYLGKMVDTPVYLNAKDILAAQAEIDAKVKK